MRARRVQRSGCRLRIGNRQACRIRREARLEIQVLEARLAPVVGARAVPSAVSSGSGWDGVVRLSFPHASCSGTLLPTGRHILTAAHCADFDVDANADGRTDRGNGAADSGSASVQFHLRTGTFSIANIPMSHVSIHPGYTGLWTDGYDLAIVRLPDLAPAGAERYAPYRGRDEVGRWFYLAGYGRSGQGDVNAYVPSLNRTGCDTQGSGMLRLGANHFDATAGPHESRLVYDLDWDSNQWSSAGPEVIAAPGDSGGPSFVYGPTGLEVAAVTSGGTLGYCLGATAWSTRVSSFAAWIDQVTGSLYDLILDMNTQAAGNNGAADWIQMENRSGTLYIWVNGQVAAAAPISGIRSVTIRGSSDADDIVLYAGDVPRTITVDGGSGYDRLTVYGTTGLDTATLTWTGVVVNGATINSGQVENVQVRTREHNDTMVVHSLRAGVSYAIDTGYGNDVLIGSATDNVWMVNAVNMGSLNGWLAFSARGHLNLTGGQRSDRFVFLAAGRLTGGLNGGPGIDTLDYSSWTSGVTVNLTNRVSTGIGGLVSDIENALGGRGSDFLIGDAQSNLLRGGTGADTLLGVDGHDILLGEDGDDALYGGGGRDILIGGSGGDYLTGGGEDDILIAGYSSMDASNSGLSSLQREWLRGDQAYVSRIEHLRYGTGWNGGYRLRAGTVFADGRPDRLTGDSGADWFWADPDQWTWVNGSWSLLRGDSIADLAAGTEQVR